MAKPRLSPALWKTIQTHWEFDLDEPSYEIAAGRAAKEHSFTPPAKSSVYEKQQKEKWSRKGNMNGLNQAAQRNADKLVDANGERVKPNKKAKTERSEGGDATSKPNAVRNLPAVISPEKAAEKSASQEDADRADSLKIRTEVNARHRNEWRQIVMLRQEAMQHRDPKQPAKYDLAKYYGLLKSAKLAAEITAIQQAGERKAWGMDVLVDPNTIRNLSDDALEAIASGKNAQ
jgi:hypothetical protein